MSNVVFADAETFYETFAKFTLQSPTTVTHESVEYIVHHTQFAGYNVQNVFSYIISETSEDPRGAQSDFHEEIDTAIQDLDMVIDAEMEDYFHYTMYIKPRRLSSVALDYSLNYNSENPIAPFTPLAETKEEAVAEILSLYHAEKAGFHSFMLDNQTTPAKYGTDKDGKPNEGVIPTEYSCAIKHIIEQDGNNPLLRPDPSPRAIREIFHILKEVGIEPSVRDIYSFSTELDSSSYYLFRNPEQRQLSASFMDSIIHKNTTKKWTSNTEPPLETII